MNILLIMDSTIQKLKIIRDQLGNVSEVSPKVIDYGNPEIDKPKYEYHRLNGWGYNDTRIFFDRQKGYGKISGSRYSFSGATLKDLPRFALNEVHFSVAGEPVPCQNQMSVDPPYINEKFLDDIQGCYSRLSFEDKERIIHSHGHTLHVIYQYLIK